MARKVFIKYFSRIRNDDGENNEGEARKNDIEHGMCERTRAFGAKILNCVEKYLHNLRFSHVMLSAETKKKALSK